MNQTALHNRELKLTHTRWNKFITDNYEIIDWNHASAILSADFPTEWEEIVEVLTKFRLKRSDVSTPGGRKSPISEGLDGSFYAKDWQEKSFITKQFIDGDEREIPTHSIDCYKNRVGLEIEWNNKDPFYDRDLNNFRLLFELRAISVGVVVTRCTELQSIFDKLGRGSSFGASTTHFDKLRPKLIGGGAGGCPVLAFGIKKSLYVED